MEGQPELRPQPKLPRADETVIGGTVVRRTVEHWGLGDSLEVVEADETEDVSQLRVYDTPQVFLEYARGL